MIDNNEEVTEEFVLEVELKFAIIDKEKLVQQLSTLNAKKTRLQLQNDHYLSHPSRNFAETDEALRLRCSDDNTIVTYKGPMLDPVAKTRKEIELPIQPGTKSRKTMLDIFEHLGFEQVRIVSKTRSTYLLEWDEKTITVELDDVVGLGEYVEIEMMASEATKDAARDTLLELAARLGLQNSERRSYLRLLIENETNH